MLTKNLCTSTRKNSRRPNRSVGQLIVLGKVATSSAYRGKVYGKFVEKSCI